MADVNVGLLVRIEALPGKEADVEQFLQSGLALVNEDPDTITWYAIRLGPTTFGIFPDDTGRQTHLSGPVAEALMGNVGEIIEEPTIEQVDLIAAKLPS
jgi:hypothetical protein